MNVNVEGIHKRFKKLKDKYTQRDATMANVKAIREGRMSDVAPDIFPPTGAWKEPIIANMIDIAARTMSESIAPLPTLTCQSSEMVTDRDRKLADQKTKIALGYVSHSSLGIEMVNAADNYVTYGFVPFRVELDYANNMPIIRPLNPLGGYPEFDRFNRLVSYYQRVLISKDEIIKQYPEIAYKLNKQSSFFRGNMQDDSKDLEVIFYHDKDWDLAFIADEKEPILLEKVPNPIGKVMITIANRPGATDIPRGQFDDVIHLQLARAQFALFQMQAAHESVNAPIIVPTDVQEIPYGPGATIMTNNPAGVGRLPIEIPASAMAEQATLERELQLGARFPSVLTGEANQSIITGQGIKELRGGFDSSINSHLNVMANTLKKVISICFEVDEIVFGDIEKVLVGSESGTPFEIKYVPSKTIRGDYSVDVRYGLVAGMNPNQSMVFLLQGRQERLFSRDFVRREMPFPMDVEEQKKKVDLEDLEEAMKQALLGYSQSIPMLASQGQDPSGVVKALAKAYDDVRKGKSITESIQGIFPEPEPEPSVEATAGGGEEEAMMAAMMGGQMPPEAAMGAPGGGIPPAPQAPPDVASLMASLNSSGEANLSARMTRNQII